MPPRHNGIDKLPSDEHNYGVVNVFVITRKQSRLMRRDTTWHFHADGFYLMPASKTDTLTGTQVDDLLAKWARLRPQEVLANGWLIRTSGDPWRDPGLVQDLRTALLDGPAVLAARLVPVPARRTGFLARLATAWAALTGRSLHGQKVHAHRDTATGA